MRVGFLEAGKPTKFTILECLLRLIHLWVNTAFQSAKNILGTREGGSKGVGF